MAASRPPPLNLTESQDDEPLQPPHPRFAQADSVAEVTHASGEPTHHVRNISTTASSVASSSGLVDSPPMTPRSVTFSAPSISNPFSPPESILSFDASASPGHLVGVQYPFPDQRSGITSMSTSTMDLSRSTFYGSRPGTATTIDVSGANSSANSSYRYRESLQPPPARPVTFYSSPSSTKLIRERPKSTMLSPETQLDKPWLSKKDPYERVAYIVTLLVMFLGVALGALKCWLDWESVPLIKGNLCPVLDEDFSSPDGIFGDNGKFFREVDMSGFGNGEFEMTTDSPNNSLVANGHLYIIPTLTSDNIPVDQVLNGTVFNITGCTFNITQGQGYTGVSPLDPSVNGSSAVSDDTFDAASYYRACSAVSNATAGTIINPVQTARLTTRKSANIRFGKVEVVAKIPTGDWLWPAIWMMPVDSAYGPWPASGEIDIMEARSNGPSYDKQGANYVRSSLNWGPTFILNAVSKTYGWWRLRRGTYDQGFHTYTLEWTEDFMRASVDGLLHHMLNLKMKKSFWDLGDFPTSVANGSDTVILSNPWANGTKAAPFDQRFYLILDVGVGGTNGWFPDGPEKPWLNGSPTAMKDFLMAKDQWYPSWPENLYERAFVIDSVKMWQLC